MVLLDVSDHLYFVILDFVVVFDRLRVMQIICLLFIQLLNYFTMIIKSLRYFILVVITKISSAHGNKNSTSSKQQ